MSLIDIIEVVRAEFDTSILYGHSIDLPATGSSADVHSFTVAGWVLGHAAEATAVEILLDDFLIKTVLLYMPRPDVAAHFPGVKNAGTCGFWTDIGVLGLGEDFELTLRVVLEDNRRLALGKIQIHRKPITTDFKAQIQPMLVTTMGRSGSTLLMKLLANHPQIIAQRLYPYETRVANYWMHMVKVLGDPANHLESSNPDLYFENIFEIGNNPFYLEPIASNPAIKQWFGREYSTRLASFCQGNIESFYKQLAFVQEQANPLYFVEKYMISPFGVYPNFKQAGQTEKVSRNYLSGHIPNLLWELYPRTREIFLVRDFRDLVCSMLSFYSKARVGIREQNLLSDTEEFRAALRLQISSFIRGYRQRASKGTLIRYEDLVHQPIPAFTQLLNYLELDASPDLVAHLVKSATEESTELKEHRTSTNTMASIDRWRKDLTPGQQDYYLEMVKEAQEEFGYN
jgi:hypothetical protein